MLLQIMKILLMYLQEVSEPLSISCVYILLDLDRCSGLLQARLIYLYIFFGTLDLLSCVLTKLVTHTHTYVYMSTKVQAKSFSLDGVPGLISQQIDAATRGLSGVPAGIH